MSFQVVPLLVALLGGGAMGALITEWFRRRRARTSAIPLIERVNRNPVASELKGIKLFRLSTDPDGPPIEIKNIREYQLTLRNSSSRDLRGAEIQFEFSSEDVEPWVSRPALSKTALKRVEGVPTEPWKKAMRWQIPQFPPKDSIEFNFQVVDPVTEKYEVALYNADNIVLRRNEGEPLEKSFLTSPNTIAIATATFGLCFLLLLSFGEVIGRLIYRPSVVVSPVTQNDASSSARAAEELLIRHVIAESQRLKYLELLRDPNGFDRRRLAAYFVPSAQGGEATERIIGVAERLTKYGLKYGPESTANRFEVVDVKLLSPEYAKALTAETWFLTAYRNGDRIQECTPNFDGGGSYELRKIDGRWLIQAEHSTIDGPADCEIRTARPQRK